MSAFHWYLFLGLIIVKSVVLSGRHGGLKVSALVS